jgi:pectate lyase-like protein/copper-binding protein NosD
MDRRGFLKTIGCAAIGSGALLLGAPKLANSRHLVSGEFVPKATNRVNVQDFGAVGDGVHDDTAAIRNAIMATPKNRGGGVFFPQPEKHYRITDTIYISDRPSLCFFGEFKPGQNEGAYYGHHGTVISCEFSNKTAFVFDFNGLQHSGPHFQQLGFIASNDSVSFIELRDQNNWIIRDCVFRGGKIAINIKRKEDNSWNLVDNCTFWTQSVCGVYDEGYGSEIRGGKFIVSSTGIGIILAPISAHTRITNVMFDNGVGIECKGGSHYIAHCKFERCNPGLVIDGNQGIASMSGRGNRIFGGSFNNEGSGIGINIKSGGRETHVISPFFSWLSQDLVDNGQNTKVFGL